MYRVNGIECETAEEALKLQEAQRMRRMSAEVREKHARSKDQPSPIGSGGCYDGTCSGYNCMRCNKDY